MVVKKADLQDTPEAPKPVHGKFVAVKGIMVHPFQKIRIDQEPTQLFYDSWVDSQVKAKLLVEVK